MSLSLKTGRSIFIWPPGSLQCQPQCACLEPPHLSDLDDTDEEVGTELLSLLNPSSSEGEGDRVGAAHRSYHIWSQPQPHCGTHPESWCEVWQVHPGSSMQLLVLGSLSSCRGPSWSSNLNGKRVGRWVQGHLGPLASACHLVIACAITCWPSHRLNALVLSQACFPTQLMPLDRVNVVSCALLKLSPSPKDCLP